MVEGGHGPVSFLSASMLPGTEQPPNKCLLKQNGLDFEEVNISQASRGGPEHSTAGEGQGLHGRSSSQGRRTEGMDGLAVSRVGVPQEEGKAVA